MYGLCIFLSVLFHLSNYILDPSMLKQIIKLHCYGWLTFYWVSRYCIFFIHSSINRHLGCFCILAVSNEHRGTYIYIYIYIYIFFFFKLILLFYSETYPEVELLDHMVFLVFIFWETSALFSIMTASNYIPTKSAWMLPFSHILLNTCWLLPFW